MSDVSQWGMTPDDLAAPDWGTVRRQWEDIEDELRVLRREYALNRAFDRGDHHIAWNTLTSSAVIREFATPADIQSRTTINKFRSRRRQLTARLTSSPLSKEVKLGTATDLGMRRARLAQQVLEAMAAPEAGDWERTRAEEVLFTMKGGNAAVCWEWDANLADPPLDPQSYTAIDQTTGLNMPCGGVRLTSLNILEFGLEPGTRRQQDARYWIRSYGATPEQVQATYRLDWKPKVDSMPSASPMSRLLMDRSGGPGRNEQRLTQVTVYTRRPTPLEPGCVIHYVNSRIVAASPWPYPHNTLNVYVFSCDDPDESWISDPFLSDLRQPQSMYNDVRTTIREHAQRAANARILVKSGSLDPTAFTDTPGEVIEYDGDQPNWMTPPEVSRWLVGEVSRLDEEINDLAGSPDVSRGVAPGDRNSGSALALLAEKADGPLGSFARDQARGWSVICTNVLRTLRHHMPEGQTRRTVIYGENNVPIAKSWTRDDIDPTVTVSVPVESTMPKSQAALRASLIDMQRSFPQVFQNIDGPTLARMLGMSDTKQVFQAVDPDDAFATWENEVMSSGEPVTPDVYNHHEKHLNRHERLRNSPAYEELADDIKQIVDEHIAAHHAMKQEAAMQAAQQQFEMQQSMNPGGVPEQGASEQSPETPQEQMPQ